MPPFESFSPNNTSISFTWPPGVTGLERIMLSAQGDLQRLLSAFFARPISIETVYSHTTNGANAPLSLTNPIPIAATSPITQIRQVHLKCAGKIVCTATSTVRITSPQAAYYFLREKYAIGQIFRKLEQGVPNFELLAVGFGPGGHRGKQEDGMVSQARGKDEELWRRYRLEVRGFECEILEVFPSREMFSADGGEDWLLGKERRVHEYVASHAYLVAVSPNIRVGLMVGLLVVSSFLGYFLIAKL